MLAELRLEGEYDYKFLLRIASENFEGVFQLIKDDTKLRELIPPRLYFVATVGFLSTGVLYKSYVYEHYSSYSTMNSSAFNSFCSFVFSIFPLTTSLIILLSTKASSKNKSHYLSSIH